MQRTLAFAGSFDPMTNGHLWVMERALSLADDLVVVVAVNASKQCWFSPEARVRMVEAIVQDKGWGDRVRVITMAGQFVAPALKRMGIQHMIRGIRNIGDFEQERVIERVNDEVLDGAQTWFVTAPPNLEEGAVSSSLVKSLIGPVGWPFHIRRFVPAASYRALLRRSLFREWSAALGVAPSSFGGEAWLRSAPTSDDDPVVRAFLLLMVAYEGPDRHHHGLEHIASVISELQSQAHVLPADTVATATLGAFLHDAVYRGWPDAPFWGLTGWRSERDESRSAELVEVLLGLLPQSTQHAIGDAVLATLHGDEPARSPAAQALVCADLAILGQRPDMYDAYARNVRREYADVPEPVYRAKRAEILTAMIGQAQAGTLFPLPAWGQVYDAPALDNLERERAALLDPAIPLPV